MRKSTLTVAIVCSLAGSLLFSSCLGSFTLSQKLMNWNKTISNKFVNELVYVAFWVLPVYEVAFMADAIVLNSIEFWSGTNPVADGTKVIRGNDANYLVKADPKGYTITREDDGSMVRLDFNVESQTWSVVDGERRFELLTWVDPTHVLLPAPDGTRMLVETSQQGLYAYQQTATPALFAAR